MINQGKKVHPERKQRVFVGLSGGVDSSVAAYLLKEEGYDVTGVFIKAWHPDFLVCDWRAERQYAMRVCAKLDIPFKTFDFEDEYKKQVIDYMVSEYKKGRTPNPDVMCNCKIKFGSFLSKSLTMGADYIATGHYSRVKYENNKYKLLTGVDKEKDQSYFLWTLNQSNLSKTLFPIGDLEKNAVRDIARKAGLLTADKKDSQGLCFLGEMDMVDFLSRYLPMTIGKVVDEKGKVIGEHKGVHFYTIGQRHGFSVSQKSRDEKPYYIIQKDINENKLVVSHFLKEDDVGVGKINLSGMSWVSENVPWSGEYKARIRYRQPLEKVFLKSEEEGSVLLDFQLPQRAVSLGQSAVLYNGDECLGGGIIETV